MADSESRQGKLTFSSPSERGGGFRAFVLTLLIVIVITLVFIGVAVRLETGRVMIQDYLKKKIGMPVKIQKAWIGLPYVLVLEDVETEGFGAPDVAGISIRELKVGFGLKSVFKLSIYGGSLQLVQDSESRWQPQLFARVGDLPSGNIADISRITDGYRDWLNLSVREGAIRWRSNSGANVLVSKLSFDVSRVRLPKQSMFFHELSVYNVIGADGVGFHDVERTWLASETCSYIELSRSTGNLPELAQNFWNGRNEVGENQ